MADVAIYILRAASGRWPKGVRRVGFYHRNGVATVVASAVEASEEVKEWLDDVETEAMAFLDNQLRVSRELLTESEASSREDVIWCIIVQP